MDKTFKTLLESINAQIKVFNDNNLKIYDFDNPEFFIKEVKYDQECDQIFFSTEEDPNERN